MTYEQLVDRVRELVPSELSCCVNRYDWRHAGIGGVVDIPMSLRVTFHVTVFRSGNHSVGFHKVSEDPEKLIEKLEAYISRTHASEVANATELIPG